MKKELIVFICTIILIFTHSCVMPKSPQRIFYKLNDYEIYKKNDFYGNVYKVDRKYLNLWIFSTYWHSIYLSSSFTLSNDVQVVIDNRKYILKELSKEEINLLPYIVFYNDSAKVYNIQLKEKEIKSVNKISVYLDKEYIFEKQ